MIEEYERYEELFNAEERRCLNLALKLLIEKKKSIAQYGTATKIKIFRNKILRYHERIKKASRKQKCLTTWK